MITTSQAQQLPCFPHSPVVGAVDPTFVRNPDSCQAANHVLTDFAKPTHLGYLVRLAWAVLGGSILLGMTPGCDRTGEALAERDPDGRVHSHFVSSNISPRTTIDQCIRTYQQLQSYQDAAFVRLRYELDGKLLEDQAPLAVGWDNQGRVGFRAYSVQAGPSHARWRAKLRDEEGLVPHQILSRALPSKVDFTWLLSDPLVAERLSAGLAGFPPQLDLLLSDRPLSGLIDDSTTLTHLPPQSIDDHACYVISVQRGPAEFVLWIDQSSLLLRRMKMPKSHLTEQMLADRRVTNIELTIEFAGAQAGADVDWSQFAIAATPDDLLVYRFVPQPLPIDTTGLGERIPGFHLESPQDETVYSSTDLNRQRKATVLLWLADHPTCRVAGEQLQRVATELAALNVPQGAVEFVTVWAEPQPPQGSTFASLTADWSLPGTLSLDREAMGRDLFQVLEAPTLVVIDANNRLQLRESRSNPLLDQVLPKLLARIVAGEDLAQEMIAQQSQALDRYQAELQMAAAADSHRSSGLTALKPYAPQTFRLRELARDRWPMDVVAVSSDARHTLWTLFNNGELHQQLGPAHPPSTVKHNTQWQIEPQPEARIEVAPSGSDVALCTPGGSVVQLFNTVTKQNRAVNLGPTAKVADFQWFTLGDPTTARLAVITRDGQTVLIDPANREQLSGRSPQEPVALLSLRNLQQTIDGHVVLADGTIEALLLSTDSLRAAATGLGKQVAATVASTPGGKPQRLGFRPAAGPWLTWRDGQQELTLARGWLATDEPALFLLDQALNQRWHYRMPLQSQPASSAISVAQDPRSGQPVWGVATGDSTIHLLRADGLIIDHFRTSESVVGLALAANGERLELILVHPRESVRYAIDWR